MWFVCVGVGIGACDRASSNLGRDSEVQAPTRLPPTPTKAGTCAALAYLHSYSDYALLYSPRAPLVLVYHIRTYLPFLRPRVGR
jgi:hypothetical protein